MLTGSNWVPPPDYDCTTRPWYTLAMEKQRLVFTVPYLDARTKEMVVTIAEPIRHHGKIIAVAAADMAEEFRDELKIPFNIIEIGEDCNTVSPE